jgi:hypothetical protein
MAKAADADFRFFLINRERDPAFRAGTWIKSGSVAFAIAPSGWQSCGAIRSLRCYLSGLGSPKNPKKSRAGAFVRPRRGNDRLLQHSMFAELGDDRVQLSFLDAASL